MDDKQTREALDSLADLFLTGQAPRTGAARNQTGDRPSSQPGDESGAGQSWRDVDPLAGPSPIRLQPTPRSCHETPPADPPEPEGHALRLHRGEGQSPKGRRGSDQADTGCPVACEGVVLGNLPGFAGPWLTQYAHQLTGGEGAVGILHTGSQIELELVAASSQRPDEVAGSGLTDDPRGTLETLAAMSRAPMRRLIVHPSAESDAELGEWLATVPSWTLITGTDAAARAAATQRVRQLVEQVPALAHRPLRLWLAGQGADSAEVAAAPLRDAITPLMQAPVTIQGGLARMGPVTVRQLGQIASDTPQQNELHRWLAEQAGGPSQHARQTTAEPAGSEGARDHGAASGHSQQPAQAQVTSAGSGTSDADEGRDSGEASPAGGERTGASPPEEHPDLATLLAELSPAYAGGVTLQARCPDQPATQLMLDQHGRLHLLRRHDRAQAADAGDAADLASLRAALADLLETRQWVRRHLELLRLTQPEQRFDLDTPPALHLFTHRGDLGAGLAHRLAGLVQLHLLQRVQLTREAGWHCTPLN